MFCLIVNGSEDPDILYITELQLQRELALQAHSHIAEYLAVVGRRERRNKPFNYSPLVVMSHCVGFLSAIANISKILFPVKKQAEARGTRLRSRLGIISLPVINSREVGNSYEHIDSRIDSLSTRGVIGSVCLMNIATGAADTPIVLKRLDPVADTSEFLDDKIDI